MFSFQNNFIVFAIFPLIYKKMKNLKIILSLNKKLSEISKRNHIYLCLKLFICSSILLQICATIYVSLDLQTTVHWICKHIFSDSGEHHIRHGLIAGVCVFGSQQLLGLYAVFRDILTSALVYTSMTAIETIFLSIAAFRESLLSIPLVFDIILISCLAFHCYRLKRLLYNQTSGQSIHLVAKMFGSDLQLDELYAQTKTIQVPEPIVTDSVGYPDRKRKERESTYIKFWAIFRENRIILLIIVCIKFFLFCSYVLYSECKQYH